MAVDTTEPSYWLNWRFLVTAIYILGTIIFAAFLIWKYEGAKRLNDERRECGQVPVGVIYKDDLCKTCLKGIHPVCLLIFRVLAFGVLLALITTNIVIDGARIFIYYTQCTFTLTTVYFGLATVYSIKGFCHDQNGACRFKIASPNIDAEQGSYVPKIGGPMDYVFQIIFQVAAGAVVLTDVVYWLIIYPFMAAKISKIASIDYCVHSVNLLVLGDAILNCMRFPLFRIAYFILWTGAFVICQWIIHFCISMPWPYPFMELSPPYAPLWYVALGILHIPCYGLLVLVFKLKHLWLSRSFPDQYQGMR